MSNINYFALTDYRNERKKFGIKKEDRRLHMYILGRTGMGKTTMLVNMILNDIYADEGLCFVDPHGDAVETLLDYIPAHRIKDVVYFNPADMKYPVPLNIFGECDAQKRHLLVSSILSVFKKLYAGHWQHRQEHILRNAILALLDYQGKKTLFEVYRLFSDWRFRKEVIKDIKDPVVKAFWQGEFSKYVYQYRGEALTPIQNKLGAFLTVQMVRNIVGQNESKINFREIIDNKKIFLVNLSKGRVGEDVSSFLGSLIVTKIQLAAMSRIDLREESRKDFYLYVDEFQEFVASDAFESILSEARKYRLCLTVAHQYMGQLDDDLRKAALGNVGTIISFPIGPENGQFLEKEFYPEFKRRDLIMQDKYHIYLKLAIDGKPSAPFSAVTLPPFYRFELQGYSNRIIAFSRKYYSVA
jgi:type IV secretory pathway TraG/TraD family ATPase VirD4